MKERATTTAEVTRSKTQGHCNSKALVATQPIPFQFESHALRVSTDAAGEPWFNVSDVCQLLELGNPSQAIKTHVDSDDLQKMEIIDSLGRMQRANHVNEPGLYALIFGSTLPKAKQFKRWVTHDVLPTIRKTGSYSSNPALPPQTQDTVSAILLIGEYFAKFPGVKPGIAMAATLDCVRENTGIDTEHLRKALPATHEPLASMNATTLGKQLGLSAREANRLLVDLGFQFKNARDEWEMTIAGQAWGEAPPYSNRNHSGYQILWKAGVLEQLKGAAR